MPVRKAPLPLHRNPELNLMIHSSIALRGSCLVAAKHAMQKQDSGHWAISVTKSNVRVRSGSVTVIQPH